MQHRGSNDRAFVFFSFIPSSNSCSIQIHPRDSFSFYFQHIQYTFVDYLILCSFHIHSKTKSLNNFIHVHLKVKRLIGHCHRSMEKSLKFEHLSKRQIFRSIDKVKQTQRRMRGRENEIKRASTKTKTRTGARVRERERKKRKAKKKQQKINTHTQFMP